MDILIRGGTVVPCDRAGHVEVADVWVRGGKIAGLLPPNAPPPPEARPLRILDARGMAVVPGFVQAHVHLCQVLFRGMADDLPLLAWLKERIWPLEAAHDAQSLAASARLGLAELARNGTTTILDMGTVHHYDAVFEAAVESGLRVVGGKTMMDVGDGVPDGLRESTAESLRESERLERTWTGQGGGRLRYAYAPRFVLSCSEALVRGAAERSNASGALLHTHVAEHAEEREAVRKILGEDDLTVLERWGLAGPRAVCAHGVQLEDDEARRIAELGTRIVHCPSANLKLGSGIARIDALDRAGVSLALGADGAPCNNTLDPWREMRSAALLAKIRSGTTSLPAERALRLATIDGARALGLEEAIGSIEVGKRADLVCVRIDGTHVEPGGDVFSRLVYACGAADVRHVLVDGAFIVRDGELVGRDVEAIKREARQQATKVVARAGL